MLHSCFPEGICMKRWLAVILCLAFVPLSAAFAQQPDQAVAAEERRHPLCSRRWIFGTPDDRRQFRALNVMWLRQRGAGSRAGGCLRAGRPVLRRYAFRLPIG